MSTETRPASDQLLSLQSRGALLVFDPCNEEICAVSQNAHVMIGKSGFDSLVGQSISETVGAQVAHAVRNVHWHNSFSVGRSFLGNFVVGGGLCEASVFKSDDLLVLELVPRVNDAEPSAFDVLKDTQVFSELMRNGADPHETLQKIVSVLKIVSGYHCVVLDKNSSGIPKPIFWTGREELMHDAVEHLRPNLVVEDVNAPPQGLLFNSPVKPPNLENSALALPTVRQIEALRSANCSAFAEVVLIAGADFWGGIRFLHGAPRVLNARTRYILEHLKPIMSVWLFHNL